MTFANLPCVDKLVALGLSKYEALAYLALLEQGDVAALDVADRSGIPKQRIYDILDSLLTKGFCAVQKGRPRYYTAHRPQQALAALIDHRRRQQALENERQTRLMEELIPSLNKVFNGEGDETYSLTDVADDNTNYYEIGGL